MNRHAKAIVAISAMLLTLALGASTASADTAPTIVSTDPAAQVGHTTALLSGEVDANWAPGDGPTTWRIQYRPEGSPDWLQANEGTLEAPDPVKVETPVFLEAKAASETYEFRLLAENAAGSAESASPYPSFATLAAKVPVLTIDPADPLGYTTATLKGTVNPEGGNVNPLGPETLWLWWELQYSPKGQGAWSTAAGQIVEGPGAEATSPFGVEGTAVELSPGSEYETRLLVYYLSSFGLTTELQGADFTTKAVAKPTVTIDPITDFDASTASFSGTVNPNAPGAAPQDPAFDATWSFSCEPACPGVSEGATVPAGDQAENVAGDATHLEPNTEYAVTLKATNGGGSSEASTSFQTPGTPPTIEPFEAGPVRHDGAGINGQINPHNSETTYWFEWGTSDCSANPCAALPVSKDASAGDGPFNQYVFRELGGLSPQTTYHFRLIAENASGTTEGPDRSFTTAAAPPVCTNADALGASQLPDCRAWEMVSPPEKNGGEVRGSSSRTRSSADGDAVTFSSYSAFGDAKGTGVDLEYLSERTGKAGTNGWSTHAITPKQRSLPLHGTLFGAMPGFEAPFTPDLSEGIFRSWTPLTNAPNVSTISNLYHLSGLRGGEQSTQLLSDAYEPITGSFVQLFRLRPWLAGASKDLSHVIFQSKAKLTPDAVQGGPNLYESVDGAVRLVGILPNGEAAPSSNVQFDDRGYAFHAISDDGSRIFFAVPNTKNIYMREDGATTVQLNASEKDVPDASAPATYWTASSDGSRAFFSTAEQLLDTDTDSRSDLYMYSVAAGPGGHHLQLISVDEEPPDESEIITVIGASEDGRHVYFYGNRNDSLVAGEPSTSGFSIYHWHDGAISLVGSMEGLSDAERNGPKEFTPGLASRVTPDGRHLLFTAWSDTGLENRGGFGGYDHTTSCTDETSVGGPCRQLYIYSADSGRLRCASCNPSGTAADPPGAARAYAERGFGVTTWDPAKALSADGRYVFFNTVEALLPEDTNGVTDAYEYDIRSGTVSLISSGSDSLHSYFLNASPDGRDVFFVTSERLSGWDIDQSYDLYDARVDGGMAEPLPTVADCGGESCRQVAPPSPGAAPVGSTLEGRGNTVGPKPCARGKKSGKRPKCGKKRGKRGSGKRTKTSGRAVH